MSHKFSTYALQRELTQKLKNKSFLEEEKETWSLVNQIKSELEALNNQYRKATKSCYGCRKFEGCKEASWRTRAKIHSSICWLFEQKIGGETKE